MDKKIHNISLLDERIHYLSGEKKKIETDIRMLNIERERLEEVVVNEMIETGCTMTEVAGLQWGLRNNPPKAVIVSEKLIPDKFFRLKKELNKTLINATITSGGAIPGVTLDNGSVSLTTRSIK